MGSGRLDPFASTVGSPAPMGHHGPSERSDSAHAGSLRRAPTGVRDGVRFGGTATRVFRVRQGNVLESLELYTVIDAETHPALAELVRSAPALPALTVAGRWVELAVPLVYHEPSLELWVLLLPEILRHRELDERAELLRQAQLAAPELEVPEYVLTPTVVTSAAELVALRRARKAARVEALMPPRPPTGADAAELAAWQRALEGQAQRLAQRLEELERREQVAAERARKREHGHGHSEGAPSEPEVRRSDRWRAGTSGVYSVPEARARALAEMMDEPLSDPALLGLVELEVIAEPPSDEERKAVFGEPHAPPPAPTTPGPPPAEASEETPRGQGAHTAPAIAPGTDATTARVVVESSPADPGAPVVGRAPTAGSDTRDTIDEALTARTTSTERPAVLAADPVVGAAREEQTAVPDAWLVEAMALGRHALTLDTSAGPRVRLALAASMLADPRALLGALDVRVTLHRAATYPVITLLVGTPAALRAAPRAVAVICLDLAVDRDRAALAQLARSFELVIDVYDAGRWLRRVALSAPLTDNVGYLLRAAREHQRQLTEAGAALSAARAVEQVLHPNYDLLGLAQPLADILRLEQLESLATAEAARAALELVRKLSEPAGEDYLICTRGFPLAQWRELRHPVLERAVSLGLWPGPELARVAVSEGLARSRRELLARLMSAFEELQQQSVQCDLSPAAQATNQEALEAEARTLGLAPGRARTTAIASEHDAVVAGTIDLEPGEPARALALSVDELAAALADPGARLDACLELCRRGVAEAAPAVVAALPHLSRSEVAQVLAAALGLGLHLEGPLIVALSSAKSYVRQGAALALGVLGGEDGTVALVELLLTEPTDIWKEIARAIGQVGPAALQQLAGAAQAHGITARTEERMAWAMAHLGARDGRRALGQMSSGHSVMAPIAAKALALIEPAHRDQYALMVDGAELDVQRAFTRQFLQAVESVEAIASSPPSP